MHRGIFEYISYTEGFIVARNLVGINLTPLSASSPLHVKIESYGQTGCLRCIGQLPIQLCDDVAGALASHTSETEIMCDSTFVVQHANLTNFLSAIIPVCFGVDQCIGVHHTDIVGQIGAGRRAVAALIFDAGDSPETISLEILSVIGRFGVGLGFSAIHMVAGSNFESLSTVDCIISLIQALSIERQLTSCSDSEFQQSDQLLEKKRHHPAPFIATLTVPVQLSSQELVILTIGRTC